MQSPYRGPDPDAERRRELAELEDARRFGRAVRKGHARRVLLVLAGIGALAAALALGVPLDGAHSFRTAPRRVQVDRGHATPEPVFGERALEVGHTLPGMPIQWGRTTPRL